jgi:hypothetical protein
VIIVVLSPTTEEIDHGMKLNSYFSLPSLAHYLILDPILRVAIHHTREGRARGAPGVYHAGLLRLDPPGLDIAIGDLFEPEI